MADRRARNRLARRLAVFGPAVIVLLTGLLSYVALGRMAETRERVTHTHDVLDASSSLLVALLDGETSQRGYLLTHDSTFLAPSRGAAERADRSLNRLRSLTADNARQQARLDSLDAKVRRRLTVLDSTMRAESEGRTVIASGIVRYGPGRNLMSDIRHLIVEIEADEDALLVVRESAEAQSSMLSDAVILIGTVLAGMLAFLVNRNYDRALRERRVALENAESSNDRLRANAVELEEQAKAATEATREAQQATRRAERLQTATEAFTGALSLGEVANLILDQSMMAMGAQSGGLAALDDGGQALRFIAVRNIRAARPGALVPLANEYPVCAAVRSGRPVILESSEVVAREFPAVAALHQGEGTWAVAAYPLILGEEPIGALLLRFDARHALSANDHAFMSAMSRIATETLERARLFDAERKARSEAEAANRAKAAFLASMSHELRTPLQAALGFAQLVRSGVYGDINDQQAEVLNRVERSQTHLARLIDDILDFARLEAGKVRVVKAPVVLAEVIGDLAPLVEPQAVAKDIELSLLPPPATLRVVADQHRLQQILVNIVGNAIKFTPNGGVIRVGAREEGGKAIVVVSDSGMGIPPDRLQAIFEPFVQVDDALTRTAAGTGLGLAISRDLARAMGGDITVESELGKGSTFSVILDILTD